MNNFLYGKCCENLRNRVSVDVITTEMRKKLLKIVSQPNYKKCQIVTEDICTVERTKTSILLNKPIFIGIENFPFIIDNNYFSLTPSTKYSHVNGGDAH